MVDCKVAEKIQQLLAMAEHPGSNEHEAALALERAQALLLRHNLTRADIINRDNTTPAGMGVIDRTEDQGYNWKRDLIAVLADANLCKVIGTPSQKTWHLFGNYDNVRAVLEMYNWITFLLPTMAAKAFREYKTDEGTERGQSWKAGYFQGAILAIKDRLDKPMQEFSQGVGTAIVAQSKSALATAIKNVYPHLTSRHAYISGGNDGRGAGRQAGAGMNLTPQKVLASRAALLT